MSNVPAYPKNPALHPESASHEGVNDSAARQPVRSGMAPPVEIADLDLSPPGLNLANLVDQAPVRFVLMAAALGFVIGRLARR